MGMGTFTTDESDRHEESYLSLGLTVSQSKKNNTEYPKVLLLLAAYLDRSVQKNEDLLDSNKIKDSSTIFHGHRAPDLSIKLYAERIFKYSECSPSCFVLALIYMERYLQQPHVYMTSLSVHRLLITSVVVAAKFTDDAFFNNAFYARVGGISTVEMNRLELDLLFNLDFRLKVDLETFGSYCLQLEKETMVLVIDRPIQQVHGVNSAKDLSRNSSIDESCKSELMRYSSQALQGCS
ncbi:cyclin-P3-1 [Oryza glaberrima]|uniref:Cyclin n=1 Tax=Oryza glaberrima TaxID=4538 RepID=I1PVE8_ORYGL|nr:cyclin-P3-1 [Oryza glaberrima]XP_052155895.1 cyclin-P3-1 [Oryza glaberrima]